MNDKTIASDLPPAPRNPAGHSPLRRPDSVRRTSSIDMTWPAGYGTAMHFAGRGRDIYTPIAGGAPLILQEDVMLADLAQDRTILSIEAKPHRSGVAALVGVRGGGYLRQALDAALPDERSAGSPLSLLIDDISGASLIAGWAWSQWSTDWMPKELQPSGDPEADRQARRARMEGICTGFRPGSGALDDQNGAAESGQPVVPLENPDDLLGWHELTKHTTTSMRRARRIDVWLDEVIRIDATFQDSASTPAGGRVAIHEYTLQITADPTSLRLLSVQAQPHILPYRECPTAAANVGRLVGVELRLLRTVVLEELRRTEGCTHLNDALRALAEVPILVEALLGARAAA